MANLWWGLEGAVSGSEMISVGSDQWADPESAVKLSWLIKPSCGIILTNSILAVLRSTVEYYVSQQSTGGTSGTCKSVLLVSCCCRSDVCSPRWQQRRTTSC